MWPANPLVQATFALQNTPKNLLNLAGITASDLDISAGILRPFDLHLYIIEEETHLRAFAQLQQKLVRNRNDQATHQSF